MIETADFKNGLVFEHEGAIYRIIWFQNHKPGKGGAVMRIKMRNVKTGSIIETAFKSGTRFKEVEMSRKKMQFLYMDGSAYVFMNTTTYDQVHVSKEQIGELSLFLKENMEVDVLYLEEEFLSLDLPASVELKVTQTVTGAKGNTVTNAGKPATLETGLEVQVPLFINEGDVIRVDTRTSEYLSRA
jgi:elongation factor P